ncbi:MAG: transposase [Ectothiorhodospiraceae bacterium AqS1]|nr:transposase [Ectothiorhodospiraceae bacterium AqS1]
MPVKKTDKATLQSFVPDHTHEKAIVYTDEAAAYVVTDRRHEPVRHGERQFVNAHPPLHNPNAIESFRAMSKKGYHGTLHQISPKHLDRYVSEFVARYKTCDLGIIDRMEIAVMGMVRKGLHDQDPI